MHTFHPRIPLVCASIFILTLMALSFMFAQPVPARAQATPTPATPSPTPCPVLPGFSEGFESHTLGRFASVVATCVPGGCGWSASTSAAFSGSYAAFSPNVNNVADQQLRLADAIAIPPSGATGADLTFWHRYAFEGSGGPYDGGVLETSIDGGASWVDAGSKITGNGYNGTIASSFSNPLAGRSAWVQTSPSYPAFYQTTVNLLSLAGKSVLIRFRQGDDSSVGADGWWVDDVQVFINGCFSNKLPVIRAKVNGADTPDGGNPFVQWLQSLWHTFAGLFQPSPRAGLPP